MSSNSTKVDGYLTRRAKREHQREQVIELLARGGSIPIVAEALKISVRRVYYIVRAVREVNAKRIKANDPLKTVGEAVAGYTQIAKEAYEQFAQTQNGNLRVQWLRLALSARDSLNHLRQTVGLIPTVTQQINLTAQLEVEWFGDAKTSAAELMAELRGVGNLTN